MTRSDAARLAHQTRKHRQPAADVVWLQRVGRWIDVDRGLVYSSTTLRPVTKRRADGYIVCSDGYCHRLVWEAARGPIPDGMVINHLNFDQSDNRISNLELTTQAGNLDWSRRAGRYPTEHPSLRGSLHHAAKLTESDVRQIRLKLEPRKVQAAKYGVSEATIKAVRERTLWTWLD